VGADLYLKSCNVQLIIQLKLANFVEISLGFGTTKTSFHSQINVWQCEGGVTLQSYEHLTILQAMV